MKKKPQTFFECVCSFYYTLPTYYQVNRTDIGKSSTDFIEEAACSALDL